VPTILTAGCASGQPLVAPHKKNPAGEGGACGSLRSRRRDRSPGSRAALRPVPDDKTLAVPQLNRRAFFWQGVTQREGGTSSGGVIRFVKFLTLD